MKEIKFKYIYGIPGKPETYFSKIYTIGQIDRGNAIDEIMDSPLLKDYVIIDRLQYTGWTDDGKNEWYDKDIIKSIDEHDSSIALIDFRNGGWVKVFFDSDNQLQDSCHPIDGLDCKWMRLVGDKYSTNRG